MGKVSRPYVAVRPIAMIGLAGLAALLAAGCTGAPSVNRRAADAAARRAAPAIPLRVLSVSPASGSTGVNGAAPITITYNQPLAASARFPAISPAIAGTWQRQGRTAVFTPQAGFTQATRVTVGGTGDTFTTGRYSTLRLQEVLAQLGYLPLSWTPSQPASGSTLGKAGVASKGKGASAGAGTTSAAIPSTGARGELSAAYAPPSGSFRWDGGYPGQLASFWSQGSANTLTRGAVTGFEADHGLPADGDAGAAVWAALLKAAAASQVNTHGYSYAVASEHLPETLTIWHDGKLAFRNLVNTGIGIAPTPIGTFPVYEKLTFQIMSGTNPDGSHYADPVRWVSYFSGGSAVHWFDRGSYGWPQSLGCVELPYTAAEQAYPLLPYGTLVTVTRS